ncbi:MAG TPA: amidohydrolase [Steroidobacteraceae bacterium]|nr:amidohydrolase [Steroidobacteraceae bacterium]
MKRIFCVMVCAALVAACATPPQQGEGSGSSAGKSVARGAKKGPPQPLAPPWTLPADPYPSTYKVPQSPPTLIRGGVVLTGTGERLDGADVLIVDGRIRAIGKSIEAPAGARVIDARNRWVTPGLIDVHSHLGVYPSPAMDGLSDGNEATAPVTANVWAEHSVHPQDPGFQKALEGGVTTLEILPGSANLVGGRSVVLKNVPAATYQGMKFPGAPYGLKMACGENPKRVYGQGKKTAPSTEMGNMAGYRAAWIEAQEYMRDVREYQDKLARGDKDAKPPKRDLKLDTLAGVLSGQIRVQMHCYRAEEMAAVIDMSKEFGYHVAAFHHGVEAYKIADLLAENGICAALWADWWGFKMEAYDGIQENLALVDAAPNGCAIVHSDSEEGIQRLNQEAGKAAARGVRMGFAEPPEHIIKWVTSNPAKALGIENQTGSLEPGKMADIVVWNRNPFSVYALAEQVLIDGAVVFDRSQPPPKPRSDFMLGQPQGSAP